MTLKLYNSLTKRRKSLHLYTKDLLIFMYATTVYDHPHIGHAKSYVSFDVIVRYLRHLGYKVRYVQNITDVGHLTDNADAGEDKILKRAKRTCRTCELVRYTAKLFRRYGRIK